MSIRPSASLRGVLWAAGAYGVLAVLFSWPLAVNLGTHFTGPPDGDTGAYVWNQWLFQYELLDQHGSPLFTREIFSLTRPANLSMHNYTIFQDLVAAPLLQVLDGVTTFNIIYLLMIVVSGVAMFLLTRHVTARPFESWLAGALFSWSPVLATRGTGHFSLVAAAPLAVFILVLKRSSGRSPLREALALGATVCWAATTDPYYAVYCIVIATVFLAVRSVHVTAHEPDSRSVPAALDVLLVCLSGLVAALLLRRGWQFSILGTTASVRGLYTPVLMLTVLGLIRIAWPYRHSAVSVDRVQILRLVRLGTAAGVVATVMLLPVLYAVGIRIRDVGLESTTIPWRSSPPGIDVLALLLPNPNHPLVPAAIWEWLMPTRDVYIEHVASLTFVVAIVIGAAIGKGWKPPTFWVAMTVTFGLLSLGPFIQLAGTNTHIPGPWALVRYVPIIRLARTPTRMSIVLMLGAAVLFAAALCWIGDKWPRHRRTLRWVTAAALLFELCPAPRPLYSASIPEFYRRIAAAGDVRVLELPSGVRDGASSVGNFTARTLYFQTVHHKPLIGGYLSRVSRRRVAEVRQDVMVDALITLSDGRSLDPGIERTLIEDGPGFIDRTHVGFVVIDRVRAPPVLQAFAIRALRLKRIDGEGSLDLYTPDF